MSRIVVPDVDEPHNN